MIVHIFYLMYWILDYVMWCGTVAETLVPD